jgi:hypothetical protein
MSAGETAGRRKKMIGFRTKLSSFQVSTVVSLFIGL